jgi:hypothetical protein
MTHILKKRALAILFFFAWSGTTFAQRVVNTTVGTPAKFEIESRVVNADWKECSIVVTQPNGTDEVVVLKAPSFKTSISYTPTMQGTTVFNWKGENTLNGKVENIVVGGVKQVFGNIGQLITLNKLSEVVVACPGNGTITIVALPNAQRAVAPSPAPVTAPPVTSPPQPPSRFRSTANIPSVMNPPIENTAFKVKYNNDSTYRTMIDDFNVNRSKQSLTALRLYSELGDANAQFLYGLAHLEDWTGLYDAKRACYWIRESAVQGLSQARLVLANKAVYNKDCFDSTPSLDEAKTWAQLASMSSERAVKENAEKLLQDILRIQITNQR